MSQCPGEDQNGRANKVEVETKVVTIKYSTIVLLLRNQIPILESYEKLKSQGQNHRQQHLPQNLLSIFNIIFNMIIALTELFLTEN